MNILNIRNGNALNNYKFCQRLNLECDISPYAPEIL